MEENQITQPEPSESNTNKPDRSKHRWQYSPNSNFLLDLISRRAWLLWFGVAGFLLTIIYISLLNITQTGFVKEPSSVVTENPKTQTDNSLPLWLFSIGLIAGVAGAVAIAKYLSSSSFHLPTTKDFSRRQKRLQQQILLPPIESHEATEIITIPSVPLPEQPPELPEQIVSEEKILIVLEQLLTAEESSEELQAVEEILLSDEQSDFIPAQENHRLATSTQSLVEMLDLRRQIPLSTLLGESFQMVGKTSRKHLN